MTYYMHSLDIDARKLMDLGQGLRLPLGAVDTGYLVHSALAKAIGDAAPKPFRIVQDDGRWLRILGYSASDSNTLHESAKAFADPNVYDAIDWERHAAKAMPEHLEEGRSLGFEIRLCPIVQTRRGQSGRRGVELDAFLAACRQHEDTELDRETIYREWARNLLERNGAVAMEQLEVESFRLTRLLRRTQAVSGGARKGKLLQRPDIVVKGSFQIRNGEKLSETLRQGLGRHKAFGFGMLLLRPR